MAESETLLPKLVFRAEDVALSAVRPVQVCSNIHCGAQRPELLPGQSGHPGLPWGRVSFLPIAHDFTPPHLHQFCEITLIRRGTACYHAVDSEKAVGPGTVVIVPKGTVQVYDRVQALAYTNVYYLPEWLSDDLQSWWAEAGLVHLFLAPAPLWW